MPGLGCLLATGRLLSDVVSPMIRKCRPLGLVVLKRILPVLFYVLFDRGWHFEEGGGIGSGDEKRFMHPSSSGVSFPCCLSSSLYSNDLFPNIFHLGQFSSKEWNSVERAELWRVLSLCKILFTVVCKTLCVWCAYSHNLIFGANAAL